MNAGNVMKSSWWCLKSQNSWQIMLHKPCPITTLPHSAFQTAWTADNDTHRQNMRIIFSFWQRFSLKKLSFSSTVFISIEYMKKNAGKAEVSWAYLHRALRMEPHPPL